MHCRRSHVSVVTKVSVQAIIGMAELTLALTMTETIILPIAMMVAFTGWIIMIQTDHNPFL
ncbi:hypothetical protein L3i20_v249130 [Paenibacillus sp. L3-i20]|nr:hypothetical protein L3i20_v249130 [Paenibacillus sp. L3-i20]